MHQIYIALFKLSLTLIVICSLITYYMVPSKWECHHYNHHIAISNQHLHCMECIRKDTKGKWLHRLLNFLLSVHIPTAIISCFVLWRWQIEDWGTWHVILGKHLLKLFVVNNYLVLFFKWMWMQMHDWHAASRVKMQMDLHCTHNYYKSNNHTKYVVLKAQKYHLLCKKNGWGVWDFAYTFWHTQHSMM